MTEFRPLGYDLTIEPDLDDFTFKGEVEIRFSAAGPCRKVALDCQGLAIKDCRFEGQGHTGQCRFEHAHDDRLVVDLPRTVESGFTLRMLFRGTINQQMTGFYRSRYRDADGQPAFMAVTQFQENYARQAFPCLDRPELKAVFRVKMVIPDRLEAVSNTEVEKIEPLPGGRKEVSFFPTPVMSTYLLFWAVGPFETVVSGDDSRLRVRALPGQAGQVVRGLEMAGRALGFCEDYFGLDYPLAKLDLIAVADFAYGAMENWGAITFRENLLLDDPDTTPREARLSMAEVITHEIVHQWFGNLVTPAGWKYLWLNESFATYLAYKAVDAGYPQWRCADMFLAREVAAALERDGLERTIAIEMPGQTQAGINVATAPIIYSKGGGMLRMVEGYIGSETFKKAIRAYLKEHAYGCAASGDLWRSFQDASGLPVADMIRRWVEQPGYPLLTVDRRQGRLCLRQSRFTYLDGAPDSRIWPLPLGIWFFRKDKPAVVRTWLMDESELEVEIGDEDAVCLVNPGRTGFWRVFYSSADMRSELARLAGSGNLGAVDRWSLEDDFFASMRKGLLTVDQYLDLLEACRPWSEPDLLVCSTVCRHLGLIARICREGKPLRVKELGLKVAVSALDAIGWHPDSQEALPQAILRGRMLWSAALWDNHRAVRAGEKMFAGWLAGKYLEPDLAGSVLRIGARSGEFAHAEAMLARMEKCGSEHLRLAIAGALGWFAGQELLLKVLDLALKKVPPRLQHVIFASVAENPAARDGLMRWFIQNPERFAGLHPILFERILVSLVPFCGLDCHQETFAFLEEFLKRRPEMEDAVWMARQLLEVNLALKAMATG